MNNNFLLNAIENLLSVSSFITLPILMFILSLIIGMKPSKAGKGALHISVGLIGISILFSFFNEVCTPVVNDLMLMFGKTATVIDTGWPTLSLFIWSNKIAYLTVPIAIAMNMMMLWVKATKTINIDIWNMWHIAVVSVLVYEATGSLLLVIFANILITIIDLKLADWIQPAMATVYKRGNVTNSHINSLGMLPLAIAGNWLIDRFAIIKSQHQI